MHGDRGISNTRRNKPSPSGELPDNLEEQAYTTKTMVSSKRTQFNNNDAYQQNEMLYLDPDSVESLIIAIKFLVKRTILTALFIL